MKKHSDYITHINNIKDEIYLKNKHFPVNMRLFKTSSEYKNIILQQCNYIRELCLNVKEGYKKPHGMSSANAGLSFNIIGITVNRNKFGEYCEIMINPVYKPIKENGKSESLSNCGSLTLKSPIKINRWNMIEVTYYNEQGSHLKALYSSSLLGKTIQHEIDHNLGILITDRIEK